MLRDELLMPALSMLPTGGWLDTDTSIKPLTTQAWEMVEMYAAEYAARVVIPDNVREDADYDMWGEILPRLQEVYGKAFDQSVTSNNISLYFINDGNFTILSSSQNTYTLLIVAVLVSVSRVIYNSIYCCFKFDCLC